MFILFIVSSHPLLMSFTIIIVRVLYALYVAAMAFSSWLSYILVIIFLRGIIVIILYITSLSSNEPLALEKEMISLTGIYLLINLWFYYIKLDPVWVKRKSFQNFQTAQSVEVVFKTYRVSLAHLTTIIIVYLLVVLLVSVKLITFNKVPLKINK